MPVLDSEYFPAGGGSVIKPYVSGMSVKRYDQVRSKQDDCVYIRVSSTPEVINAVVDPAYDKVNFIVDDQSNPPGTIKTLIKDVSDVDPVKWIQGQAWLKTGTIIKADSLPRQPIENLRVRLSRYELTSFLPLTATLFPQALECIGDSIWVLVCTETINTGGKPRFFISRDDGLTWEEKTLPVVNSVPNSLLLISDNNNGIWFHTGYPTASNLYYTPDLGTTWVGVPVPFTSPPRAMAYYGGTLYFLSPSSFTPSVTTPTNVVIAYKCNNPGSASATWVSVEFNTSIYSGKGVPDGLTQNPATIDIDADGNLWIVTQPSDINGPGLTVLKYENSSWTALPYQPKASTGGNYSFSNTVIGTIVEKDTLKIIGIGYNTYSISEYIYKKNANPVGYELDRFFSDSSILFHYGSVTPNNRGNTFMRVNNITYIYASSIAGRTSTGAYQSIILNRLIEGNTVLNPGLREIEGKNMNQPTCFKVNSKKTCLFIPTLYVSSPVYGRSAGNAVGTYSPSVMGMQTGTELTNNPNRIDYIRVL